MQWYSWYNSDEPHDWPQWDRWAAQGLTIDEMRAEMDKIREKEVTKLLAHADAVIAKRTI